MPKYPKRNARSFSYLFRLLHACYIPSPRLDSRLNRARTLNNEHNFLMALQGLNVLLSTLISGQSSISSLPNLWPYEEFRHWSSHVVTPLAHTATAQACPRNLGSFGQSPNTSGLVDWWSECLYVSIMGRHDFISLISVKTRTQQNST